MSIKETVKQLQEYVNVPLAELVESSTNPRKTFDEERLEELAESIRSKGILSPLLTRRVNSHFEIVSGARRYRAAMLAGLREAPVRIVVLTDEEALETQIVENLLRSDASVRGSARVSRFARTRRCRVHHREDSSQDRQEWCLHRQTPSALGPHCTCGRCVHRWTHWHRTRFADCQTCSRCAGERIHTLL
jgi:hypothetical protein